MSWWPLGHQAIAPIGVLFSQNAVTYLPEINLVGNRDWENNLYFKNMQH